MDRIRMSPPGRRHRGAPARVQIIQERGSLEIHVIVPELRISEVAVGIEDGSLVVEGLVRPAGISASFRRAIPLPEDARTEAAQASMFHGVITIRIPT